MSDFGLINLLWFILLELSSWFTVCCFDSCLKLWKWISSWSNFGYILIPVIKDSAYGEWVYSFCSILLILGMFWLLNTDCLPWTIGVYLEAGLLNWLSLFLVILILQLLATFFFEVTLEDEISISLSLGVNSTFCISRNESIGLVPLSWLFWPLLSKSKVVKS